MNTAITVLIASLLVIIIIGVLFLVYKKVTEKRWACKEGGCEIDIDGEYTSKRECMKDCNNKEDETSETLEASAWACAGNDCVRAEKGYTTKDLCEQNCPPPYQHQTYYYPQSLLPPVIRPYRWGYPNYWRKPRRDRIWRRRR
jgi:hypothetical protein